MKKSNDSWTGGDPYEYFMGRWSRLMAPVFLKWLNMPDNLNWLDIGCGTGALSDAVFNNCNPSGLTCIDPSEDFLKAAKVKLPNDANLVKGGASEIPLPDNTFDVTVSGLALNFFPDKAKALSEIKRVTKQNSTIAAYVWDYSGRMDFLRYFWDAAGRTDPATRRLDEGIRFLDCNHEKLNQLFEEADLTEIKSTKLDIDTVFKNFNDYWDPFLGGQGPAPGYLNSLPENVKEKLKTEIHSKLPVESDGSIKLLGRAIAIRAIRE